MPAPRESRAVMEQRRRAKEWSERFNRLGITPDSEPATATATHSLTPVEAAKLAAQQRIKSQVKSKVEQISTTSTTQGTRRASTGTRKSSGKGRS
jgi:DNA-binding ferritin-like protein